MLKKPADRFFAWYCHPEYYEDIKGDLEELFERQRSALPEWRAELIFAGEVLWLFRPSIIRPFQSFQPIINRDMIQNYLKVGIRNLLKYRTYSAIHILGLAVGLAAFLLIDQYTSFEKSYDRFHQHPERLYRLVTDNIVDGRLQVTDAMSFAPSGKVLRDELPEVESYTTTLKIDDRIILRRDDQVFDGSGAIMADSTFLKLFNYPLLEGDPRRLLNIPNTVVLTEKAAERFFGDQNPLGQELLEIGPLDRPLEVVGVIKDLPGNTHYRFDLIISLPTIDEWLEEDAWNAYNYYTYLQLGENADPAAIAAKLPPLSIKHIGEDANLFFRIQPVTDIHLHSNFTFEPQIHGSARAVSILGIVSLFILIIAWVNYINLSTARALERAKEVAMRKIVGAGKPQLIGQFLTEALLINFLGAVVAFALVHGLAPYFNSLVGKEVLLEGWKQPLLLRKLLIFFFLGTFIAGIYPALVLSSFDPIGAIKGQFSRAKGSAWSRKGLVVIQFVAALVLVANTIIVFRQVQYMTGRDIGINTDLVLGIQNPEQPDGVSDEQFTSRYNAFLDELGKLEQISAVGSIGNLPGGGSSDISSSSSGITVAGLNNYLNSTIYITYANDQLQHTLDAEILAGRNFDRDVAADTSGVIINEALLQKLNVPDPDQIIDQQLYFGTNNRNRHYTVVGVMKDFNRTSLKSQVEPTIFFHRQAADYTVARLTGRGLQATLSSMETTWKRFYPQLPFDYNFLDERFAKLYSEDRRFGTLFANFSLLAILVAGMGLFGLASFLSVQRTKEVGVRKVLGASVPSIVLLFFRDFFWLILIAALVGMPLIFLGMNQWLDSYAYRIAFPWWVMIVAMAAIALFAFLTVGYQTYKVAILNPARTIKHE